jgi:hypothetical protein
LAGVATTEGSGGAGGSHDGLAISPVIAGAVITGAGTIGAGSLITIVGRSICGGDIMIRRGTSGRGDTSECLGATGGRLDASFKTFAYGSSGDVAGEETTSGATMTGDDTGGSMFGAAGGLKISPRLACCSFGELRGGAAISSR